MFKKFSLHSEELQVGLATAALYMESSDLLLAGIRSLPKSDLQSFLKKWSASLHVSDEVKGWLVQNWKMLTL
jgi:hypothetical protein